MQKEVTIHWFRQDLRLTDNPSLFHACKSDLIIPIYIFDEASHDSLLQGQASLTWLYKSLFHLNKSLSNNLLILRGNPLDILKTLASKNKVSRVFWNRCYSPREIARDSLIKKELQTQNIDCKTFNGSLLWEPWEVLKDDGTPYRVFTSYYRKGCSRTKVPRLPLPSPKKIFFAKVTKLQQVEIVERASKYDWQKKILKHAFIGERNAEIKLMNFLKSNLSSYRKGRDFPASGHVSSLAPNIHFGEISVNQIWTKVNQIKSDENTSHFFRELGWREFAHYLLYHNPKMIHDNLQSKFDSFPWDNDSKNLQNWQFGQTGIPMVDAGMRELWETGSMHNRLRMIVGSFLVKNLLIDWRLGARWFWDCLFDADLASNTTGWQWISGCGVDAVPYFRIFNPISQGKKFDPNGDYIRRFVPELRNLELEYIFAPWESPKSSLKKAGITLGKTYPFPIVDLTTSRQKALKAFSSLKKAPFS